MLPRDAIGLNLGQRKRNAAFVFLLAFFFACVLFWWLPSLLFRGVLDSDDPVDATSLLISATAMLAFVVGFQFNPPNFRTPHRLNIEKVSLLAWRLTLAVTLPAMIVALVFVKMRSGFEYGQGEGLAGIEQAVLYLHLFAGFLYLGASSQDENRRRILAAVILIILPRLIISTQWGRFFVAQALVPIFFLAVARGWMKINYKFLAALPALVALIVFAPSLARGDSVFGDGEMIRFFSAGSTLKLYQENKNIDAGACPPLLTSLTAKTIPWGLIDSCTIDIWGQHGLPRTLDRILAFDEIGDSDSLTGPGSNYLLELHLTGGNFAIVIGSLLFGYTARGFSNAIVHPSIFSCIWIECLTRALFAPRSNLGYVYERIPSLVLTCLLIALAASLVRVRTQKIS